MFSFIFFFINGHNLLPKCNFNIFYRVLEAFNLKSILQVNPLLHCIPFLCLLHPHMNELLIFVSFLQLLLYVICHPSWDIRRMAHESTKKIIAASPELSESLLLEFSSFLSMAGERSLLLKRRYFLVPPVFSVGFSVTSV